MSHVVFSRLHRPSPHIPSYETKLSVRFTCDVVYMFFPQ